MYLRLLTVLLFITLSFNLAAGNHHDEHHHDEHHHDEHHHDEHHHDEHEVKSQDVHLHGYAEITVAIEGNLVEINLDSPSANIVGFEHKASTESEIETATSAQFILMAPKTLFSFNGTECKLSSLSVDVSKVLEDPHSNGGDSNKDHADSNHSEEGDIHSDITASYQFACENGAKLGSINMILLDYFSGIETLKVDWLKEGRQGSSKLSDKSKTVEFK